MPRTILLGLHSHTSLDLPRKPPLPFTRSARKPPPGKAGPDHAGRAPQTVGIFRTSERGGRIVPITKKGNPQELPVPPGWEGEAKDGDLVAITVLKAGRFGPPQAKVRHKLANINSETAISLIAIHAHNIPFLMPPDVVAEAEAISPAGMEHREDWRALPLITIDPFDAKDHDDAVHAVADDNPDNAGGFIVTVAIADVAAYVRPGSMLDVEALKRGNSVYFPDRVVPMLPERLSNDLCSLKPQVDRPALAVRMVLGADGAKRHHSFHRIMMRSAAKLSYQQAQAAIDGRLDDITTPLLEPVLRPLWAAYATACLERARRAPLDLDLPERKLVLNAEGRVTDVTTPERLDAHRLIEEFMILANVAAAETLEQVKTPLVYRAHDEPSLEKMRALQEVMASLGVKLPKQGALQPALFNGLLAGLKGTANEAFLNEIILRTQAQAEYTPENYGHFGLNLRKYAHFTSPIRRYADLIVHRALIRGLKLGAGGLPDEATRTALKDVAERISNAERRAMAAERETVDRLIAHFLADQVGASFDGRIAGVTRSGLFVKLAGTGADGFVPASSLGADYYAYDEAHHALTGRSSGESFRLGDTVRVKLVEAAPVAGALRFEITSEGQYAASHKRQLHRRGPAGLSAPKGSRPGRPAYHKGKRR
jgi:ribonuclease R